MRVAMLPDWRAANPYQHLLAEALTPLGVEVMFPQGYRRGLPLSRALLPTPRPDVLHLHWPTPYLRSARTALRALYCLRTLSDLGLVRTSGISLVWTVHNLLTHDTPTPRLERWFSARLAKLADALIVHSDAAADEVVAMLGAQRSKITVIPHGSFRSVYGAPVSRAQARAAFGLPADVPVVLFFGMIRPYKGVPRLLRAWSKLGDRRGKAQLIIAGAAPDPEHEAEIRSLADGVSGVRLDLRHIADDEVPTLMASADVMALPFEKSLTSGTVRLARDYGVPLILSEVVGGKTDAKAIYVPDTGAAALGEAILSAIGPERLRSTPSILGDWSNDDWSGIAEQHRNVFLSARQTA